MLSTNSEHMASQAAPQGRRCLARCVVAVAGLVGTAAVAHGQQLYFSSATANDLYQTLNAAYGIEHPRYDSPLAAITAAPAGSGVLILADGYPLQRVSVSSQAMAIAQQKGLKLFVEFPSEVGRFEFESPVQTVHERAIVTSQAQSPSLNSLDILQPQGLAFVKVRGAQNQAAALANAELVAARVAGYDEAVFGLPPISQQNPLLYEHPSDGDLIISTTRLSNFNTGRFGPNGRWKSVLESIVGRLDPAATNLDLAWTPTVRPTYSASAELPANAIREAVRRGAEWHLNSRMLIHESWADQYANNNRVRPGPDLSLPVGDGSHGILEGFSNQVQGDGTQLVRWYRRNDVNSETAAAMAVSGLFLDRPEYLDISTNINNFVRNRSIMSLGDRANPQHPSYGMVAWGDVEGYEDVYYGDDNARANLSTMLSAAATGRNEWNDSLARSIVANMRMTSTNGFQPNRWEHDQLETNGWQPYFDGNHVSLSPHYQSHSWATFFWAYDKTGEQIYLDRGRQAIEILMDYGTDEWRWTNGIQQERARMLLPLAWLVRVDDTPQHRQWLATIAGEMLEDMDLSTGAIREELGLGPGTYTPPANNNEYGMGERPLIQQNGDPAADLIYTVNFALLGLREAAAATGDPTYIDAENRLVDFVTRIQIESENHPELDGAWFRAFDYEKWEYWASNSDVDWGAWSIEAGWTQGWLVTMLSLREMETSVWDFTSESPIGAELDFYHRLMIEESLLPGDLNLDGETDLLDWESFVSGMSADLAELSAVERYLLGDLDGDEDNDLYDFKVFKAAFNTANGVGAFEKLSEPVPEPSTGLQLIAAAALMLRRRCKTAASAMLRFATASGKKSLLAAFTAFSLVNLPSAGNGACAGEIIFVGEKTNDIVKATAASTDLPTRLAASPREAVAGASQGDAVILLADDYPQSRVQLDASVLDEAASRQVRVFIEYPASLPRLEIGEPVGAANYRGVIAHDWFGERLKPGDIVTLNGLRFLPTTASRPLIVAGKVAGYDRAIFGIPESASPILFQLDDHDVLVATTKLSHCITARNAPVESWQALWSGILGWLVQDDNIDIQWTPAVRPRYERDAALPRDAEEQALRSGIAWFKKAKLILTPSLEAEAIAAKSVRMPVPPPATPTGDGSFGSMEGVISTIDAQGQQLLSTERRGDCICETAMALALAGEQFGEPRLKEVATNLVRFYLLDSPAQQRERGDKSHGAFGLVAWGLANDDSYRANYGDDNARIVLSSLVVSAVNKDSQFDSSLAKCLLANLRTTGQLGFRGNRIDVEPLTKNGWQHYYRQSPMHLSAHHEAYPWACYLWAYEQSGEELFLKRAIDGIERMMASYPDDWRWTNGMAQERARILLPLAWLVRVQDTPRHRRLLQKAVDGLLALQVECGAIREELGLPGNGVYPPPESNDAYGSMEAPLIAANGDSVADLLYTTNFALLGLHEAAAATGDARIRDAEDKLVDFLCRVQISAPTTPYLDGGWFRAFDFRRWEYFGSNADSGWGAWSIESGWTQAWITAVLAMRARDASLWDLTQSKGVGDELRRWAPSMLPAEFRRP